jgi:hypothetical protein
VVEKEEETEEREGKRYLMTIGTVSAVLVFSTNLLYVPEKEEQTDCIAPAQLFFMERGCLSKTETDE